MEQTINCIAVDDDAPALRVIEQYINKLPQLKLVAKFRNHSTDDEELFPQTSNRLAGSSRMASLVRLRNFMWAH